MHLQRQFACGRENQGADMTWLDLMTSRHQALKKRQRESCRFTGSGLSCTHHVVAIQHSGNRLLLNRRWFAVTLFGQGPQQTGAETQGCEGGCGGGNADGTPYWP